MLKKLIYLIIYIFLFSTSVCAVTTGNVYLTSNKNNSEVNEEENITDETNNAKLQGLRLDIAGIIPSFDSNVFKYYLTISNEINSIEVLAIPENINSTVQINGNDNLKEGLNNIEIRVISEDKTQQNVYNIEVTKVANVEDANTNLETLAIENVILNPAFDNSVINYFSEIAQNVEKLNILAIPENEGANVAIEGNDNLQEGNNTIKITVTAPNGFTKKEIEIIVYKKNADEEKVYEEEQGKLEEKLDNAYEIEKVSSTLEETNKENVEKNNKIKILILTICFVLVISVVTIYRLIVKRRQ